MVLLKVFDSCNRGEMAILGAIVLPVEGCFALGFIVRSIDMAHCLHRWILVRYISRLHKVRS